MHENTFSTLGGQKILLLLQFLAFASGSDQPGTMRPSGIFDVIHHMLTYLPSRLLPSMNIKGKGPIYRSNIKQQCIFQW